ALAGRAAGRALPKLAAQLRRRAPVGRAEEPAVVLGAGEAPPARDREDRLLAQRGVEEVAAGALEPLLADPLADAHALALEQLVEVAGGDEAGAGDRLRAESGIAEVLLDEELDVAEDLVARPEDAPGRAAAPTGVQPDGEVERALGQRGRVAGADRAVLEAVRELADEAGRDARQAFAARDPDGGEAADPVRVVAEQLPRDLQHDRLERPVRARDHGLRGLVAHQVARPHLRRTALLRDLQPPAHHDREVETLGIAGRDRVRAPAHRVRRGGDPEAGDRPELVAPEPAREPLPCAGPDRERVVGVPRRLRPVRDP